MIGIMDWGIGGLGVYKALRTQGTTADVIYFSDSGFTPYGKTERATLRTRLNETAEIFKAKGVSEVIVACNAASSALGSDQEIFSGVTFTSIIPCGVRAVEASSADRVGIIGGLLTINSGIYQRKLKALSRRFSFVPAQPLSGLVEAGVLNGEQVDRELTTILHSLGDVDAVLLACTHYPALAPALKTLAPHIQLLDPALYLRISPEHSRAGANALSFFTSGSLQSAERSAKLAWDIDLARQETGPGTL